MLPTPGEILVKEGDYVTPDDVIGYWMAPGKIVALDVAHALGVPPERVRRYMLAHQGDVTPHTIIAQRRGLLRSRRMSAGIYGTIIGLDAGVLWVRSAPQRQDLQAGLAGHISQVFPHQGVTIRMIGACVRGVWGCGGETWGILHLLQTPEESLRGDLVEERHRGSILVGGRVEEERFLMRAALFGIRGIIAGSLAPTLQPLCHRLPYPLVITEGLGQIPMAAPIFALLEHYQGHRAIISGEGLGYGPEVLIPHADDTPKAVVPFQPMAVGNLVRLTEPSLLGTIAQIESVPQTPQPDAVGRLVYGAYVRLPNRQRRFVPDRKSVV